MQFMKQDFHCSIIFCIIFEHDTFGTVEENKLEMDFFYILLCYIIFLFHSDPSVSCLVQLLGKLFCEILWLQEKVFGGLVGHSTLIEYFWPFIAQIKCRDPFPKKNLMV